MVELLACLSSVRLSLRPSVCNRCIVTRALISWRIGIYYAKSLSNTPKIQIFDVRSGISVRRKIMLWCHRLAAAHTTQITQCTRENRTVVMTRKILTRGDWKRETWHRETFKIVGTDIARLDNVRPCSKGGHRETCFNLRVSAHLSFFVIMNVIRTVGISLS